MNKYVLSQVLNFFSKIIYFLQYKFFLFFVISRGIKNKNRITKFALFLTFFWSNFVSNSFELLLDERNGLDELVVASRLELFFFQKSVAK